MLHSIVKRSDARWRLFVDKLSGLHLMPMSSDALAVVSMSGTLHPTPSRSDERLLMPKLLHPIAMRLDALGDCLIARTAAPDRETIRCTLTIVCLTRTRWCWLCVENAMPERLHLISNDQMHWRSCLIVRLLHSTVKRPDTRWQLSVAKARWSDVFRDEKPKCCTWWRCHQMHWRGCLIVRLLHSTVKRSDARWRLSVAKARCSQLTATSFAMKCRRFCTRCWDRRMHWRFSVVLAIELRADKLLIRSKCRFVAFDRVFADLATELDKTKWCWLVWNVLMKSFDVFFIESIDLFADFVFKKSSTTVESQSCPPHLHSAEIRWKI